MICNGLAIKLRIVAAQVAGGVRAPFFVEKQRLHVLSYSSGDVLTIDEEGRVGRWSNTCGQPAGAAIDVDGAVYVADVGTSSILLIDSGSHEHATIVDAYEGRRFKGPSAVAIDGNGSMFFTDSGAFGETGLHMPKGSLYRIGRSPTGQTLTPIAYETLAYPSGVAVSPDGKCVYVTEMMTNRVIRYVRIYEEQYHGSVFYQFHGGVGPSCIACGQNGVIFVGHYDIPEVQSHGKISVLSSQGTLLAELAIPGPQLTGLAVSKDNKTLIVTEKSTSSIYEVNNLQVD